MVVDERDEVATDLAAVERAESRLTDGTYGLSIESGTPIPDGRLHTFPTAERGSSGTNATDRGTLNPARFARQCASSSSAVAVAAPPRRLIPPAALSVPRIARGLASAP